MSEPKQKMGSKLRIIVGEWIVFSWQTTTYPDSSSLWLHYWLHRGLLRRSHSARAPRLLRFITTIRNYCKTTRPITFKRFGGWCIRLSNTRILVTVRNGKVLNLNIMTERRLMEALEKVRIPCIFKIQHLHRINCITLLAIWFIL